MSDSARHRGAESAPAICLVAHFAYGALAGGGNGHIGGVERQTSLTARWLAARGHRVSLVTWDGGQSDDTTIDGVRVIKMCRQKDGLRGVRFFHPRWTSLNRALRAADADLYYQNCAEYVTGQVGLWCHRHGRKFVFSVANDPEVDPRLPGMHLRERVLYRYGLRAADRIVVQTRAQQARLREGFGLDSVVIPMPCPGPPDGQYQPPPPPAPPWRVLWVGRICEQKRPDRLLELARACPELQFDLVGPPSQNTYSQSILEQARRVSNVALRGPVPRERMPDVYRAAACLCCSSDVEGFPNTFLEAWSQGLPIVSTFDPDGLIAARGLGAVARNVAELAAALRTLLNSPQQWCAASANARRYYMENHTVETILPRFERLFLDVLSGSAPTGRSARETDYVGGMQAAYHSPLTTHHSPNQL
jgi:glycosyltransferase involved in cell wall biosynthesis